MYYGFVVGKMIVLVIDDLMGWLFGWNGDDWCVFGGGGCFGMCCLFVGVLGVGCVYWLGGDGYGW